MGHVMMGGTKGGAKFDASVGAATALGLGLVLRNFYRVECRRGGAVLWLEEFENAMVNVGRRYSLRRTIPGASQGAALNSADVTDETKYADGRISARNWVVAQAYAVGDIVRAVTGAQAGALFMATVAGTSHATVEPTWPAAPSDANIANGSAIATVVDNTVTWQRVTHWYLGLKTTAGGIAAADTMGSHVGWGESTAYSNTNRPGLVPGAITIAADVATQDNAAQAAIFNINATATITGAFLCDRSGKGGTTGLLYGVGDFANARSVFSGDTLTVTLTTTAG